MPLEPKVTSCAGVRRRVARGQDHGGSRSDWQGPSDAQSERLYHFSGVDTQASARKSIGIGRAGLERYRLAEFQRGPYQVVQLDQEVPQARCILRIKTADITGSKAADLGSKLANVCSWQVISAVKKQLGSPPIVRSQLRQRVACWPRPDR